MDILLPGAREGFSGYAEAAGRDASPPGFGYGRLPPAGGEWEFVVHLAARTSVVQGSGMWAR